MTRLIVECRNSRLAPDWCQAAIEKSVHDRLIELCGGIERAEFYHAECGQNSNPINHFNRLLSQAWIDCVNDLGLPPKGINRPTVRFEQSSGPQKSG